MRSKQIRSLTLAAAAVLLIAIGAPLPANVQEKSAGRAAAPSAKLVGELEKLQFYVGTWDYTEDYEKSPSYPNGGHNSGVYTSKLGPGGNSLINSFHSQGPVGDFEGFLVMTWDPSETAYKSYAFADAFPGCLVETGHFEGDVLVYRGEFAIGDQHIGLRNATRLTAPDLIESDEFITSNGRPEKLLVHVRAVKRK